MCSKFRIGLITLCLGSFLALPYAQAMNVSLVGGINRHHPSTNPDPPTGSSLTPLNAFDYGVLADAQISDNYRFEFGAIRHTRTTLFEAPTTSIESTYRGWLVPLTFRFMRADFLGFGFGPYLGFMSSHTKSKTTYLNGSPALESESDNPNQQNLDVGLRINLRIALPVSGEIKALFDASYLVGFTDLNKSSVAEDKNQEFLFLLGLQLPLISELPSSQKLEKPNGSH